MNKHCSVRKLYDCTVRDHRMYHVGAEEARKKLPELIGRAERDGTVTIVSKRGVPRAAIVPISHVSVTAVPKFTALRGSAGGCYGDVAGYIDELRREW